MTIAYSSLESKQENAIKNLYSKMLENERAMEENIRDANTAIQKEIKSEKTAEVVDQFEKKLSSDEVLSSLVG